MRKLACTAAIHGGLLSGSLLLPLVAMAALSNPSSIGVKFIASGPAGLSIVGESAQIQIHDDGQSLTVIAPLSPLHTGIGLRDRHMKEKYLEVEKYPNAEFRLDRNAVAFPAAGSKLSRDAHGELKLHGHSKAVAVHYVAARDASGYSVTANFQLNIKDYGIEVPSYLGVTVKPDVDVTVQFHVQGS